MKRKRADHDFLKFILLIKKKTTRKTKGKLHVSNY